jgi:hypothetical protein
MPDITPSDVNTLAALAHNEHFSPDTAYYLADDELSSRKNESILQVLNAIATVSVREVRGEIYAVGLQVTQAATPVFDGQLCLTMAGNRRVPHSIRKHIEILWDVMKRKAEASPSDHRDRKATAHPPIPAPQGTPGLPEAKKWAQTLRLLVYDHSRLKFIRDVEKYWDEFEAFTVVFKDKVLPPRRGNRTELELYMTAAITLLFQLVRYLDPRKDRRVEWERISTSRAEFGKFTQMMDVMDNLRSIVKNLPGPSCDKWAKAVSKFSGVCVPPFFTSVPA